MGKNTQFLEQPLFYGQVIKFISGFYRATAIIFKLYWFYIAHINLNSFLRDDYVNAAEFRDNCLTVVN